MQLDRLAAARGRERRSPTGERKTSSSSVSSSWEWTQRPCEALALDHRSAPTSFLRGPASVAFMRAAWPWVNMNIAASST